MAKNKLGSSFSFYVEMQNRIQNSPIVQGCIIYCIRPIGADGLDAGVYGLFDGYVGTEVWQDGFFHIDSNGHPTLYEMEDVEDSPAFGKMLGELTTEMGRLAVHDDEHFVLTDQGLDFLRKTGGDEGFASASFSPILLRSISRVWPIRIRFY